MSLDEIETGQIRRTLGGGLVFMGLPTHKDRYGITINFSDVIPMQLIRRTEYHTIGCSVPFVRLGLVEPEAFHRPARDGCVRYLDQMCRVIGDEDGGYADPADVAWTYWLPNIRCMALYSQTNRDEWGGLTSGSVTLLEDKPL